MINIAFSQDDINKLRYERFHHPHPRVQQKMEALYLKSLDLSHNNIQKICNISGNTLRAYLNDYRKGGIDKLKEINFYQPKSELESHKQTLKKYFEKNPPATVNQVISIIKKITGIERKPTQVRKFMVSIGLKRLKVAAIPQKADIEEQKKFKKTKLKPRIKEAKKGKRIVLFMDAAHFVFKAYLGYLWSFTRIFIKAPSGRKRFNILGAINIITHEVFTITNETYINALSICAMLTKAAKAYVNVPITIILDNARYQKCKIVTNLAKSLNIELLFLPTYSPNLNLIERLWKFVKKECLYSKFYENFSLFKSAIMDCLNETKTKHKKKLVSLLSLKFQVFKKAQIMTA